MPKRRPTIDRFLEVRRITPSGCWRLRGRVLNANGYATIWNGERSAGEGAHQFAYRHWRGPIPDGLEIDHLCRKRWCVNPDHLDAVPRRVNLLRGTSPNFVAAAAGTCERGHPRERSKKPSGSFHPCRQCHRDRMAADPEYAERFRARKREERARYRERQIALR